MVPVILVEELWIMVSRLLSIDDIEALAWTCRELRASLTSSIALWRAVVEDLLLISPNDFLSRSLPYETAQSLHAHALRFCHVDRALSTHENLVVNELDLPGVPVSNIQALVGTGCMVYRSFRGSVHVISLATRKQVDVWNPPKGIFVSGRSNCIVGVSTTHGLVVAVRADVRTNLEPRSQQIVWLFRVSGCSMPRISLFMKHIMPKHQRCCDESVIGDTLMMLWSPTDGSAAGSLTTLDFLTTSSSATTNPSSRQWSLESTEPEWGRFTGLRALTSDTIAVASATIVAVFRLPPEQGSADAPVRRAHITLAMPGTISFVLGQPYPKQGGDAAYVDICTDAAVYIMHFTDDYTKIDYTHAWSDAVVPNYGENRLPLTAGPQRACRYDSDYRTQDRGRLVMGARSLEASQQPAHRLGNYERCDVFAEIDRAGGIDSEVGDMVWDEWVGIGGVIMGNGFDPVDAIVFECK